MTAPASNQNSNLDDFLNNASPQANAQTNDPDDNLSNPTIDPFSGFSDDTDDNSTDTDENPTESQLSNLEKAKTEEETIKNLNQAIGNFNKNNPNLVSSRNKEIASTNPETVKYQEISQEFEPEPEVAEYIKPTQNAEAKVPEPIEDNFGEIIMQASQVPQPNITLPIEEEELEKAFHQKVVDSIRWLAEWCKRTILMAPKRVFFPEKKSADNATSKA